SARRRRRPALEIPREPHEQRRARGRRPVHARGDRDREEPPVHRLLRAGGGQGDGGALPRHHRARRASPPRAGPPNPPAAGHDAGGAGGGAARRAAHAGAGRRAAEEGARDGRHPPRPGVLMDALEPFRELARTPDARIDLTRAALAVARIEHPDVDVDGEAARLDSLAARSNAAGARGPHAALERLVAFLFEEEGFRGNDGEYYDPRNSCLNDVLDRKLGIPITLSVLTMEVGRRIGLDIAGVGLPGHFIVSVTVGSRAILLDPFHGGGVLTPASAAEVAARAVGRPVKIEDAHWTPCTRRQIVVRMLRNLKTIYARQKDWGRALGVIDRLLLIDPEAPTHLRDRGTVLVKAGQLWEGAAEWESYLNRYPSAQDAESFRHELRRVRQELGSRN